MNGEEKNGKRWKRQNIRLRRIMSGKRGRRKKHDIRNGKANGRKS